ncbi:MAG TPA: response regulator transcription factor [Microbacteriaceae bacterium]|jgi:DNA-binding NarL/FixJ family response regulator|nr:response regulator transcription factor [Microbacteriaceae bacterium]
MPSEIRVLVVEDSWEWLGAAAHVLSSTPGFVVVGTASTVEDTLAAVGEHAPDIALIDVMLAGESGLRAARVLRARRARTRVVLISSDPPAGAIREARAVGVAGFLLKGDLAERDALAHALRKVSHGERVFSAGILTREQHSDTSTRVAASRFGLTPREMEVTMHLANGLTTSAIALEMHVGEQAVRNYIADTGRKLGASGRLEIVVTAIREGLVAPPGLPTST